MLGSEQNLLLYRTIAFGIWALVGSLHCLLRTRRPVDRGTLRLPFYQQCYLVSPFALVITTKLSLISMGQEGAVLASVVLSLLAAGCFRIAQVAWLRQRTSLRLWRCAVAATLICIAGPASNSVVVCAGWCAWAGRVSWRTEQQTSPWTNGAFRIPAPSIT